MQAGEGGPPKTISSPKPSGKDRAPPFDGIRKDKPPPRRKKKDTWGKR